VTASHCTITPYINSSTPYWQPSGSIPNASDPNFIGTEVHDVPLRESPSCIHDWGCRWSDAAGMRYAPGVNNAFGRIYRTTGFNSIQIDPSNPFFTITGELTYGDLQGLSPMDPNDFLHKVGRTTGWTRGPVHQKCMNMSPAPGIMLLCQYSVQGGPPIAAIGDSGSPVFVLDGGNNVRLAGLLWGAQGDNVFLFSPMFGIRAENTPPDWITH
jgi:hypothetical protein